MTTGRQSPTRCRASSAPSAMRFRISACQPCEISSLRNMLPSCPDPASATRMSPEPVCTLISGPPPGPSRESPCVHLPPVPECGGHGVVDDDAPRTGRTSRSKAACSGTRSSALPEPVFTDQLLAASHRPARHRSRRLRAGHHRRPALQCFRTRSRPAHRPCCSPRC